ncbi:MAG TPA: TolC family protein [Gemmatimonadales bacterium]|nr:TolC family protein [Gemmatimonadales bacterium]
MVALLLALQGVPSPQPAQDSLPRVTLTLALERAARLDPNYVAALGQIDNAQWARRNAFAVFILPAVTIGTTMQRSDPPSFLFTDSLVRTKTLWTANLVARYDLFTGGQKIAELTRSAAALEGANADELRQRLVTAQLTEADYYAVLADVELDRVARDRLRRAQQQLAVARARVVSGAAVSTDSLNLRLELARAQVGQIQQQSALRVARLALGRRVGIAGPVDAEPVDTAPAPDLPIALADAISEAAQQGPEYRIAAANERAASAIYRAELGNYLPRATLTFTSNTIDQKFYPQLFTQQSLILGISLPIWNNGLRELNLSRARVLKDVARVTREDMDRGVQADVTAVYDFYETARASARLAREAVVIARENFRVQQTRYSAGATTILDLITAQVALSQAEGTLVESVYATRLARAGLETILGRRLFTDRGTQ